MQQRTGLTIDRVLMDKSLFLTSRTTIASYPGGKSDRRKHSPLFLSVPDKIPFLVEPFAGLGNFFLVVSPRVSRVWLNDKDPEIYAILHCIQHSDLLLQLVEWVKSIESIERDDYYEWKSSSPTHLLERAVRRLVILNCSPNGAGGGYSLEKAHRKWYQNKPRIWKKIHDIFFQKQVRITDWDYSKVLSTLDENDDPQSSFCYLDPPYIDVAKRGNLYGKSFNMIDWEALKHSLEELHCHWVLSNRDNHKIHQIFSEYTILRYNSYNDMNNTQLNNPEMVISNRPFQSNLTRGKSLEEFLP